MTNGADAVTHHTFPNEILQRLAHIGVLFSAVVDARQSAFLDTFPIRFFPRRASP
jgi:hypothetical protein